MEDIRYDVQGVKKRLLQYLDNDRDVENEIERLERLESRIIGLGAQQLSDMPRSPSHSNDRITDLLSQKDELETKIRETVQFQAAERATFEEYLKHVEHADGRAVIRMHYFDGYAWPDVRDMIFGGKEDFLAKETTYLRRVHKIHGAALLDIAKYIYESNQSDTAITATL